MHGSVGLADAFPNTVRVGEALCKKGLSVAIAESCTGGLLGAVLTAVSGSSAWVRGGVIAYSNTVKVDLLGVDAALLEHDGAVSATVAEQMADGVRRCCGSDIGIGITGVAGPLSDGSLNPVGLIFVAITSDAGRVVRRLCEDRGREANRAAAVVSALEACLELLEVDVENGR